jgi:hypothetical protein
MGKSKKIDQVRQLTATGCIIIRPWTNNIVDIVLIKSMPGHNYNYEEKCWCVSTAAKDSAEVVKIARKLKLQIHPVWLRGEELVQWLYS